MSFAGMIIRLDVELGRIMSERSFLENAILDRNYALLNLFFFFIFTLLNV